MRGTALYTIPQQTGVQEPVEQGGSDRTASGAPARGFLNSLCDRLAGLGSECFIIWGNAQKIEKVQTARDSGMKWRGRLVSREKC